MVYIKWQCPQCKDIVISNSFRHHQMDVCKCGKSGLDLEEYMTRMMGSYKLLERYDYNFFDDLVIGMKEQGWLEFNFINKARTDGRISVTLQEVMFIRKLEDKILESLK